MKDGGTESQMQAFIEDFEEMEEIEDFIAIAYGMSRVSDMIC